MKQNTETGYSLIELSIVMLIVAIFASSAMNLLGKKNMGDKYVETKEKMEKIAEALKIYKQDNLFLPCPGRMNRPKDNNYFAIAADVSSATNPCTSGSNPIPNNSLYTPGSSNYVYSGDVPAVTIGLPVDYMIDGWGRKISYIVNGALVYNSTTYNNAKSTSTDGSTPNIVLKLQDEATSSHLLFRRTAKRSEAVAGTVTDCDGNSQNVGDVNIPKFYYTSGTQIRECQAFILISHGPNTLFSFNFDASGPVNSNTSGMISIIELGNATVNTTINSTAYTFDNLFFDFPVKLDTRDDSDAYYYDDIVVPRSKVWLDN